MEPLTLTKQISLEAVSYRYPQSSKAAPLAIDLVIPIRESTVIIGRTGAGKTTLADVILGLLPAGSGTIRVDDVPVTTDNLRAYRSLFGYVPQTIFLVDGTIRQNIAFGVPEQDIDDSRVERACRAAQLLDFIHNELADEFDSVVGERGVRLSGGQRQRIGIARALYRD